jgi:signal transduction histidine kinase
MAALPGNVGNQRTRAEQAALRRVAALSASGAPPYEVFASVTGEAGRLLHAARATMGGYGPDATIRVVATWGRPAGLPVGAQWSLGGQNLHTRIFRTRRPGRIDDPAELSGAFTQIARKLGVRPAVGAPLSLGDHLWGVVVVESRAGALPTGSEDRLAGFTEVAATAIANAECQAALTASRARILATADATRRRIERNLHDGAQQRLVSLTLDLRSIEAAATGDLVPELDRIAAGLDGVLEDLREFARGLHPAILTDGGLRPALKTLARRSAIPVHLDIQVAERLPEPVEIAAYYAVSEALSNAAKHAGGTVADIEAAVRDGVLQLRVRDDGRGGADFGNGSGLVGLRDRAEALGGHLRLDSPSGAGTTLEIQLPLEDGGPRLPPEPGR